jgi:hypothetical protein
MKSGWKAKKRWKKRVKSREKNFNFFLFMHFYLGGRNVINKKGLFYAKFFEFEEFTIGPFFCSSIQPQHTVRRDELLETCRHQRKHLLVSLFERKKPPVTTVK